MHKHAIFTIESNAPVAERTFRMVLRGATHDITAPGQFVNVAVEGFFLRRPLSVCDLEGDRLTLVCKTAGAGTEALSRMQSGQTLDLLTGLGNGFLVDKVPTKKPLLVGGGVGAAPLLLLARRLREAGREVQAVLGFNTSAELFMADELRALGVGVHIATLDGSLGTRGFVTELLPALEFDYIYACGPLPMMQAVSRQTLCGGEYSLEERMGCGFGACMGCTCHTANGPARICKEGPVFKKEDILWNEILR